MPSDWLYIAGRTSGVVVQRAVSQFAPIGGDIGANTLETTESNVQILARAAYTWSTPGIRVTQNNLDATTSIFARLGGADQAALEIQVGAGATGFIEDTAGSVSVADGDLINFRVASGAGAHGDTITLTAIVSVLQHASLERPMVLAVRPTSNWAIVQATTEFAIVVGVLGSGTATESEAQYTLRQGVTFSNLRCVVGSNSTDNASTLDLREDGVSSTNLTISIGAGATGAFEDTDSEVVATGSNVNYRCVAGAGMSGDNLQIHVVQMLQQGSVTGRNTGVGALPTGSRSPGTTNYVTLEGTTAASTTELDSQVEVPAAVDVTDMFVRVTANSLTTAATTVALRVAGADSALDLSIGAGATGIFEDSDTVSLAVDDLVNWEVAVAAGGAGTITISIIALEQGQTPVGVDTPFDLSLQGIERIVTVRAY